MLEHELFLCLFIGYYQNVGRGGGYLVEDFMGGGQMHVLGVLK